MAKTSVIEREKKRERIVKKYSARRAALKTAVKNLNLSDEERYEAQLKLQALPRDANPIRQRTRCQLTGRPRGVYRRVGLGRSMFRIYAMQGDIPGIVKASW